MPDSDQVSRLGRMGGVCLPDVPEAEAAWVRNRVQVTRGSPRTQAALGESPGHPTQNRGLAGEMEQGTNESIGERRTKGGARQKEGT